MGADKAGTLGLSGYYQACLHTISPGANTGPVGHKLAHAGYIVKQWIRNSFVYNITLYQYTTKAEAFPVHVIRDSNSSLYVVCRASLFC